MIFKLQTHTVPQCNSVGLIQTPQWCHSSVLGSLGDVASVVISPFLFFRPFILRVCSLSRFCFCMCIRPNLVPKASWDMFFFFLGCVGTKDTMWWSLTEVNRCRDIHLTDYITVENQKNVSHVMFVTATDLHAFGPSVCRSEQVVWGHVTSPHDKIKGRSDLLQFNPGGPTARFLQQYSVNISDKTKSHDRIIRNVCLKNITCRWSEEFVFYL